MLGLRVRLLILLLSATLAVFAAGLLSMLKIQRHAEEQAQHNAMNLARTVSANQEHLFEQTYQLLIAISKLPQVRKKDWTACRTMLSALMEPAYANLGVIDMNGALLCGSHPFSTSTNLDNQGSFRRALQSGDFAIEDYQPASTTGKPVLNVAYPIMEPDGNPRGVVFASLNLASLYEVAALQVPLEASFNLIDGRGTVLVGNPASEKAILSRKPMIQNMLGEFNGGLVNFSETDGASRLIALWPVQGPLRGEKLFVGIDVTRKSSNQSFGRNVAGLVIIVALITTIAWLGGDLFVVHGFHSLLGAAKSFASGNLSARSRLAYGKGELGQLARAFDDLADSLERRDNEAKEAAEDVRAQYERHNALHEINLAITSSLDLTAILTALLEKIDLLLPYSAATVQLYNRETGRLEPIASRNVEEKEWKKIQKEIQRKTGLGLPNVVFENKAPLVVENAQTDPRTMDPVFFRQHGFVSYLGVPLIAKGETLGVLSFYTKKEHRFSRKEIDFLTILAGQAAIAIDNSQLFTQVTNQAVELEKSNRIKNEFLAVMSHELRTPLNIIMNYTDIMKAGILVGHEQGRALEKVGRHSRELLKMVNDILEVAKLESATVELERKYLNVADLLSALQSEYSAPLEKDVELIWSFPSEFPRLETDHGKLKQILNRLIDNAIKFTDHGTVSISTHWLAPSTIEFRVRDTGIGIAKDSLPVIFEKCRQIDSTDSRPYGGAGLGLYLACAYTQMLGGTIAVESQPGVGSTFTVRLPTQEN